MPPRSVVPPARRAWSARCVPDPRACRSRRDRRLVHHRACHRRGLRAVLRVAGVPARDPDAAQAEGARRRQALEQERDGCGLHRDRSLRRRGASRHRARAPGRAHAGGLRARARQQHQGGRQPQHHDRRPPVLHRPRRGRVDPGAGPRRRLHRRWMGRGPRRGQGRRAVPALGDGRGRDVPRRSIARVSTDDRRAVRPRFTAPVVRERSGRTPR